MVNLNEIFYYRFDRKFNHLCQEYLEATAISANKFSKLIKHQSCRVFTDKSTFYRKFFAVLPQDIPLFFQLFSAALHYGQLFEVGYE